MVILIRHGKAVETEKWSGPDRERPLTEEGERRTQKLAKGSRFLLTQLKDPLLYTSPYRRAYETAIIFGEVWKLEVIEHSLFEPGWDGNFLSSDWLQRDIIIVGHMPDVKNVLFTLTRGQALIDFQPPSLAVVSLSDENAKLIAYLNWKVF